MPEDQSVEHDAWPSDPPPKAYWPPIAPERESKRFYRLIDERIICTDKTQEITLACGHRLIQVIPIPDYVQYMFCSPCLLAWMDAEKRLKSH